MTVQKTSLSDDRQQLGGGQERRLHLGTISTSTVGTESLVIIAEPAGDGIEANYSFLAQEGLAVVAAPRGAGTPASALETMLEGVWAGDGNVATRTMERPGAGGARIRVFTWTVEE